MLKIDGFRRNKGRLLPSSRTITRHVKRNVMRTHHELYYGWEMPKGVPDSYRLLIAVVCFGLGFRHHQPHHFPKYLRMCILGQLIFCKFFDIAIPLLFPFGIYSNKISRYREPKGIPFHQNIIVTMKQKCGFEVSYTTFLFQKAIYFDYYIYLYLFLFNVSWMFIEHLFIEMKRFTDFAAVINKNWVTCCINILLCLKWLWTYAFLINWRYSCYDRYWRKWHLISTLYIKKLR